MSAANLVFSFRYHDWEDSSIRNLKGPHTCLPAVRKTLPYSYSSSPPSEHAPNLKQNKADTEERTHMECEAQRERKNKQRAA
jgi:hypothetical protein